MMKNIVDDKEVIIKGVEDGYEYIIRLNGEEIVKKKENEEKGILELFKEILFDKNIYKVVFKNFVFTENMLKLLKEIFTQQGEIKKFLIFSNIEFNGAVDLNDIIFEKPVIIDKVTFRKEVKIRNSEFHNLKIFDSEFHDFVSLYQIIFEKKTEIIHNKFFKNISFTNVKFHNEVDFSTSHFFGNVSFNGIKFCSRARFDSIILDGEFNLKCDSGSFCDVGVIYAFRRDILSSYLSLRYINFSKNGRIIIDSCYLDHISFIGTSFFSGKIIINNPKYAGDFNNNMISIFKKIFGDEIFLIDKQLYIKKKLLMKHYDFLEKYKEWINSDLYEKCQNLLSESFSFYNFFKKIKILDIICRISYKILFFMRIKILLYLYRLNNIGINRHALKNIEDNNFDFEKLKAEILSDDDITLDNVLNVYRQLREYYDYMLRYYDAGRFFIGEMRLLRYAKINIFEKIVNWMYDLLALYGENVFRPFLAMLIIICVFTYLYGGSTNFMSYYLNKSLLIFLQIKNINFKNFLEVIEKILGIIILGSFYISLRRRFERKFRH